MKTPPPQSGFWKHHVFFPVAIALVFILITAESFAQVRPDINTLDVDPGLSPAQEQAELACLIKNYIDVVNPNFIMMHMARPDIHTTPNLLTWHNFYINIMEEHLKSIGMGKYVPLPKWDPNTCIPYDFFNGPCAAGIGYTPPQVQCISNSFFATLSSTICSYTSRDLLTSAINGPHGSVHVSVGGSFGSAMTAPGTSLFLIWHGWVDDAWKEWECDCDNPPGFPQILGSDLRMKDRSEDLQTVLNDGLDVGYEPFVTPAPMWESEDIWVRNQDDGKFDQGLNAGNGDPGMQMHQNPICDGSTQYVYVRVRNRGCSPSPATGKLLDLRWAKASVALDWPQHWNGNAAPCNVAGDMGDLISIQAITPSIAPGDHEIFTFQWIPNDPSDYTGCNAEPWHFCLLARIIDPNLPDEGMTIPETSDLNANVYNNNNIVWKNVTVIDQMLMVHQDECSKDMLIGGVVALGNPYENGADRYDLNFTLPDNLGDRTPITEEAEIKVVLDQITWDKWRNAGYAQENVSIKNEECRMIKITGNPAALKNLNYQPRERSTMYVTFNFLSDKVTATREFDYRVIQTRSENQRVIGGETYHIKKDDRPRFLADAGSNQDIGRGDRATLQAEDIGEPAIYNWYIAGGERIAEQRTIEVAPPITTEYEVEVIARSDGFKCYDRVTVHVQPFVISSLSPNPANEHLTVTYHAEDATSAVLVINQPYGNQKFYPLNTQQNTIDIGLLDYIPGFYFVQLICNDVLSDTESLIVE